jgi:hypothetical protein
MSFFRRPVGLQILFAIAIFLSAPNPRHQVFRLLWLWFPSGSLGFQVITLLADFVDPSSSSSVKFDLPASNAL